MLFRSDGNFNISQDQLNERLESIIANLQEKGIEFNTEIGRINDSISKKQLYWIVILAALIIVLILIYFVLERKRLTDKEDILSKHKDIFEKQIDPGDFIQSAAENATFGNGIQLGG